MERNPKKSPSEDYLHKLSMLEEDFKELRAKYEAYFNGIERIPPTKMHDQFDRALRLMSTKGTNRTANRFRFNNLQASYIQVKQYWTRTMRQIEEGTYRKHLFKVKLRYGEEPIGMGSKGGAKKTDADKPSVPLPEDDVYSLADDHPKPKVASPPRDHDRGVFDSYLAARTRTGEAVDGLKYEKLKQNLEKQREQIKQRYQAKDVEFRVVIEGGKAKIKAKPKK